MHKEYFEIPQSTIARIYDAKRRNRRVVALGTTVTRTLEYANDEIKTIQPKHPWVEQIKSSLPIFEEKYQKTGSVL
jgi:S-adenosylmethionine:tRNA ribosyltransferase-isomerase